MLIVVQQRGYLFVSTDAVAGLDAVRRRYRSAWRRARRVGSPLK
ncbi:MAG: hypothetical protein ACT4NP_12215 [Pseudonocardiales bacterium]